MHRHGYQGRKLQLAAGPRRALIRGQITSLVLHEAITTTEAKAKEVAPHFERLVTYAKKGTLASERALRAQLLTENAVQKLIQELKPAFESRIARSVRPSFMTEAGSFARTRLSGDFARRDSAIST